MIEKAFKSRASKKMLKVFPQFVSFVIEIVYLNCSLYESSVAIPFLNAKPLAWKMIVCSMASKILTDKGWSTAGGVDADKSGFALTGGTGRRSYLAHQTDWYRKNL